MENLDKLFQLYESGNLLLALQLCQAEGIDKKVFVKTLYNKYEGTNPAFYYANDSASYSNNVRFCTFNHSTSYKTHYTYWYVFKGFHSQQIEDTLDNILDKFLEIIENE